MKKKNDQVNALLTKLRIKIDRIDQKLLALLAQRAACSRKIGDIKKKNGLRVFSPKCEQEILARLCGKSCAPLTTAAVCAIYKTIMRESRKLQRSL
jgi:chorismate mutase